MALAQGDYLQQFSYFCAFLDSTKLHNNNHDTHLYTCTSWKKDYSHCCDTHNWKSFATTLCVNMSRNCQLWL